MIYPFGKITSTILKHSNISKDLVEHLHHRGFLDYNEEGKFVMRLYHLADGHRCNEAVLAPDGTILSKENWQLPLAYYSRTTTISELVVVPSLRELDRYVDEHLGGRITSAHEVGFLVAETIDCLCAFASELPDFECLTIFSHLTSDDAAKIFAEFGHMEYHTWGLLDEDALASLA